ncbi:MAG: tetratricopeptide repeat protein, partial [Candidatus Omnitrophota bacterium]
TGVKYNSYRPLQMLSCMLDYSLWKLDVRGYHLSNILLHILATLSIYWLVNILYNDRFISLVTSSLFIVHPIHTEAISYISGRSDPLSLLFMLLCFVFYIKGVNVNKARFYILSLFSYALALLSRENSLILPILLLLYHYSFKKRIKPTQFLSILSLGLVYIVLRITLLKSILPHISSCNSVFDRLPGFFVAIASYLKLLLFPFNLHMEYAHQSFNFTNPKAILGAIILISLLVYAFRKKQTNQLAFFSISWFFITLLPVSNLYPINAYMAEHWLYLPSIGFFLLSAKSLGNMYKSRKLRMLTTALTIGILVFYAQLTIIQNIYWREPVAFYERALRYVSHSPKLYNNLGNVYCALNRKEEAIATYKKAIKVKPDNAGTYNNLGFLYNAMNKHNQAITSYKKAIEINPGFVQAYYNLGNAYYDMNNNEEAIASYKRAISINPDFADAYNNLGNVYRAIDKNKEAIEAYKKAIAINPDFAMAYYNLGNLYAAIDKHKEAIASYQKAIKKVIELKPDHAEAYYNLGVVYEAINQFNQAIAAYQKAIELNPEYAEAYYNLGVVYEAINQFNQAIAAYEKAVGINPDYAAAYYNLGNVYNAINRKEQAIASYKKAISANPGYTEAYNNLGVTYNNINQHNQAIASLKKAIEIDPQYAKAYFNQALAYEKAGHREQAIDSYNKFIQLSSSDHIAYVQYATERIRQLE